MSASRALLDDLCRRVPLAFPTCVLLAHGMDSFLRDPLWLLLTAGVDALFGSGQESTIGSDHLLLAINTFMDDQ